MTPEHKTILAEVESDKLRTASQALVGAVGMTDQLEHLASMKNDPKIIEAAENLALAWEDLNNSVLDEIYKREPVDSVEAALKPKPDR